MLAETKERLIPPPDGWRWAGFYSSLDGEKTVQHTHRLDPVPFLPEHALLLALGDGEKIEFYWLKEEVVPANRISYRVLGHSTYSLKQKPLRLMVSWSGRPEDGYDPRPTSAVLFGPTPPLPMGRGQQAAARAFALDCLPVLREVRGILRIPRVSLHVASQTRAGRGGWKPKIKRYYFEFDGKKLMGPKGEVLWEGA